MADAELGLVERLRMAGRGLCSEDPAKYAARGLTVADALEAAARIESLEKALTAMANGADRIGEEYRIVQPLLAIYREHGEIIEQARNNVASTLLSPEDGRVIGG